MCGGAARRRRPALAECARRTGPRLDAAGWPSESGTKPSPSARRELANSGDHAFIALRNAVNTAKPAYTEEIVATNIAAGRASRVEMAQEYLPAMIDALWVGNHGAKVLAIQALSVDRNSLAVAPMIDSAIDDPTLIPQVVQALGTMRYQQARFYLEKMMMEGPSEVRPMAASSLAQIGGAALGPLKNALKAPTVAARTLAARALLPAATEYDLGAIYEYLEKHADDDVGLTQALRASAVTIEKAIAARDAKSAADSPKDF
jgi:HEAT repeat protein